MGDRDPSVEAWAEGMRRFGETLRECGERIRKGLARLAPDEHTGQAHAAIRDELTACVLGARKRPELGGDFADPEAV